MSEVRPPAPTETAPSQPESPYARNLTRIFTGRLTMTAPKNEGKSVSPGLYDLPKYHDKTLLADEKDPKNPEEQYPLTDLIKNNSTRLIESILRAEINPSTPPERQKKILEYHQSELDDLGITATINQKGKLVVSEKKVDRGSAKQEVAYQEMILKRLSLTLAALSSDLEPIGSLVGKQDRERFSTEVSNKLLSPDPEGKKNPFVNRNLLVNMAGKKEGLKNKEFFQALRQACAETHDQWLQAKITAYNEELDSMLKQSEVMSNLAKQIAPDKAKKIAGETVTLRADLFSENDRLEQLAEERDIMQEKVEPVVLLDWAMARYSDIKLPPSFLVEEQKLILERENAEKSGDGDKENELIDTLNRRRQVMRLAMLERRNFNLVTDPTFASNPELIAYISQLKQSPEFADYTKQLDKRQKQLKKVELPLAQIRPQMLKDFIGTLARTPNEAQKKIINNIAVLLNVPGGQSLDELNANTSLSDEQKKQIADQFTIIKKDYKALKTSDGLKSFLQKLGLSNEDQQLAQMFFKRTQDAVIRDELSADQRFGLGFRVKFDESRTPSLLERANPEYNRQSINTTHINEEAATKGLAYLLAGNARLERRMTDTGGWVIKVANEVPKGQTYKNSKGTEVVATTDTEQISENGIGTKLTLVQVDKGEDRIQPKISVVHTKDGVRYVTQGVDVEAGMNAAIYAKTAEQASVDYVQNAASLTEVVQPPTSEPQPVTPAQEETGQSLPQADIKIDYPPAGGGQQLGDTQQLISTDQAATTPADFAQKTQFEGKPSITPEPTTAAMTELNAEKNIEAIETRFDTILKFAETAGPNMVEDVADVLRLRKQRGEPITDKEYEIVKALLNNPITSNAMQDAVVDLTPQAEAAAPLTPPETLPLSPEEIKQAHLTLNLIESQFNNVLGYARGKAADAMVPDVVNGLRLRQESKQPITKEELAVANALLTNPNLGKTMQDALELANINLVQIERGMAASGVKEAAEEITDEIKRAKATLPTVERGSYDEMIKTLRAEGAKHEGLDANTAIWAALESAEAKLDETGKVYFDIDTLDIDDKFVHDTSYLTQLNDQAKLRNIHININTLNFYRFQDKKNFFKTGNLHIGTLFVNGPKTADERTSRFLLEGADIEILDVTSESLSMTRDGENKIQIGTIGLDRGSQLFLDQTSTGDLISTGCVFDLPFASETPVLVDDKQVAVERNGKTNFYQLKLVEQPTELDIPAFLRSRAPSSAEKTYKLVPVEEGRAEAEEKAPPPPQESVPPFTQPPKLTEELIEEPLDRFRRVIQPTTEGATAEAAATFRKPEIGSREPRIELTNLVHRLNLEGTPLGDRIKQASPIGFAPDGVRTEFRLDLPISLAGTSGLAIVNNLGSMRDSEAVLVITDLSLLLRDATDLMKPYTVDLTRNETEWLNVNAIGQPVNLDVKNFNKLTIVTDSISNRGRINLRCTEFVSPAGRWSLGREVTLSPFTDFNLNSTAATRLCTSDTTFTLNDPDNPACATISVEAKPLRILEKSTTGQYKLKIGNLTGATGPDDYIFALVPVEGTEAPAEVSTKVPPPPLEEAPATFKPPPPLEKQGFRKRMADWRNRAQVGLAESRARASDLLAKLKKNKLLPSTEAKPSEPAAPAETAAAPFDDNPPAGDI